MERYLYAVFSIHSPTSTGVGSSTSTITGLPDGEDRLTLKEIRLLEADMLKDARTRNAAAERAILVSWHWLRSNQGMSP